jgi:hypothetical protein
MDVLKWAGAQQMVTERGLWGFVGHVGVRESVWVCVYVVSLEGDLGGDGCLSRMVQCRASSRPLDRRRETTGFKYSEYCSQHMLEHHTRPRSIDIHRRMCRRHPRLSMAKISATVPRTARDAHIQCQQLAAEGIAWMSKSLAT